MLLRGGLLVWIPEPEGDDDAHLRRLSRAAPSRVCARGNWLVVFMVLICSRILFQNHDQPIISNA